MVQTISQGQWYSNGTKHRPALRGVIHQIAFFASPILAALILPICCSLRAQYTTAIFMFGFSTHYGLSYIFHRWNFSLKGEMLMAKLDHAGIFLMIAGSYTPVAVVAINDPFWFLLSVWALGAAGMISSALPKPHRVFNVVLCISFGALILTKFAELMSIYTPLEKFLQIFGLVSYITGGLIYGLKRPDPFPAIFGFHEIFHLGTLLGSLCVYFLTYSILLRFS